MKAAIEKMVVDQQLRSIQINNWLGERASFRDERGDITPRMVGAGLMAGTAIAVLAIVRTRLTTKANTLDLGN